MGVCTFRTVYINQFHTDDIHTVQLREPVMEHSISSGSELDQVQQQQNAAKRLFHWKRWCHEHILILLF